MDEAGEWERLAALLDDDEAVGAAVQDAVRRGGDEWEALLDGLDEAGSLAFLQASDTGMELTDALAQLPRVFAAQPDLDDATDLDDLMQATRAADLALRKHGLRILRLVEEDDTWPLVVVPEDRLPAAVAIAARLGRRLGADE